MQIFDMDGTLIDSNGIWKDVDTAFLAKRGLPYTKEYYEGVAHTIFPLAARFTKEFCHLPESEEAIMAEWMDMAGDSVRHVCAGKARRAGISGKAALRRRTHDRGHQRRAGTLPHRAGPPGSDAVF